MSVETRLAVDADARPEAVDAGRLLDVLESDAARRLLSATSDRPATASELAERCGIPSSTVYRLLGELASIGLVRKSVRLDRAGHHAAEYDRPVSEIVVSLDDGFRVSLD